MTRQLTAGRHRPQPSASVLSRQHKTAAVVLVAATGLGSSSPGAVRAAAWPTGAGSAAVAQPAAGAEVARPAAGVPDATTREAFEMLTTLHPEVAREARVQRRLGADLTRRAETATSAAKTRVQRAAAARLAQRARQTRAAGAELTAQAEAMYHGIGLMTRFVAGTPPTGTPAQLAVQVRRADAAHAYLFPLAVAARNETRAALAAAQASLTAARTDKARRQARQRLAQAQEDAALARLFVRVADVVRLETKRVHAAHAAATARPTPTPSPTATPTAWEEPG